MRFLAFLLVLSSADPAPPPAPLFTEDQIQATVEQMQARREAGQTLSAEEERFLQTFDQLNRHKKHDSDTLAEAMRRSESRDSTVRTQYEREKRLQQCYVTLGEIHKQGVLDKSSCTEKTEENLAQLLREIETLEGEKEKEAGWFSDPRLTLTAYGLPAPDDVRDAAAPAPSASLVPTPATTTTSSCKMEAAEPVPGWTCCICVATKPKNEFSKSQRKNKAGRRRCKTCASGSGGGQTFSSSADTRTMDDAEFLEIRKTTLHYLNSDIKRVVELRAVARPRAEEAFREMQEVAPSEAVTSGIGFTDWELDNNDPEINEETLATLVEMELETLLKQSCANVGVLIDTFHEHLQAYMAFQKARGAQPERRSFADLVALVGRYHEMAILWKGEYVEASLALATSVPIMTGGATSQRYVTKMLQRKLDILNNVRDSLRQMLEARGWTLLRLLSDIGSLELPYALKLLDGEIYTADVDFEMFKRGVANGEDPWGDTSQKTKEMAARARDLPHFVEIVKQEVDALLARHNLPDYGFASMTSSVDKDIKAWPRTA